jgi:hypothetical protein
MTPSLFMSEPQPEDAAPMAISAATLTVPWADA